MSDLPYKLSGEWEETETERAMMKTLSHSALSLLPVGGRKKRPRVRPRRRRRQRDFTLRAVIPVCVESNAKRIFVLDDILALG